MKKTIALILALCMLLSFASCGAKTETAKTQEPAKTEAPADTKEDAKTETPAEPAKTEAAEPEKTTVTVVDSTGREVEVPKNPQRIVAGWGVKNYICMNINDLIVNEITDKFCLSLDPDLANGGSIKRDGNTTAEAIAELDPDVVVLKWNSKLIPQLEALGIPVLGLSIEDEAEMKHAIEMFGLAFGREDRAKEILDYYDTLTAKAEELTKDIPENEKKTAIFLGQYVGSTAPDTTLQGLAIEQAGGINPAADFGRGELWAQGGMEKVMEWDPEYIFMANHLTSRDYTLESTIEDPANQDLTAVKNGHVYESPCEIDLWMYPTLSIKLGVLWMIHTMYPERLSDAELESIVLKFYKTIYGMDVTREQLGF
ncbi:MAG: ABC transporter substrate-binding protein [Firmicutes bacterium]|nr:ABC transporter substrate-binding protein [Bacillota bacterium]